MTATEEDLRSAANLWGLLEPWKPRLALLTTASANGTPHATWMGAVTGKEKGYILTIASPQSRKARNVRQNPSVEWLLSKLHREQLLYVNGQAQLIDDSDALRHYWDSIPGKGQAFFLRYFETPEGITVIRTKVDSVHLVTPKYGRRVEVPLDTLWMAESA